MDFVVIYGSVREAREGIKAARYVLRKVEERGHEVKLVDPMEYPLPMLDKTYKELEPDEAPLVMRQLSDLFSHADGFIFVTSEYNHSVPGQLKNMIDHFWDEYFWKPSAIVGVSSGPFGGVRAAMTLRVVLPEVGMPTIPTILPIGRVQEAFDDDGLPLDESYDRRIKKFLDELEWYAAALKAARKKGVPY